MLAALPKELLPRRSIDHRIELIAEGLNRMPHAELLVLRKQLNTTKNIRYSGITLVGVNTICYYNYLHNHV